MKLKRVLLITLAAIRVLLMFVTLRIVIVELGSMDTRDLSFYSILMNYVSSFAGSIKSICLLAVVDFVFCIGRKSYSKSMFAISITMFAFAILLLFEGYILVAFKMPTFFDAIIVDQYAGFAYFLLWTALKTLPFVGLTIAYIVSKWKFLKTLPKEVN